MAHKCRPQLVSTEKLLEKAREAISSSRRALYDFRLLMQDAEDRRVGVSSRRESWLLLLDKCGTSAAEISRLRLGKLPAQMERGQNRDVHLWDSCARECEDFLIDSA
jgi:hypothetical protein